MTTSFSLLRRGRAISAFVLTLLKSNTQRKHTFRWLRSLRNNYLLDEPSPWLVFDAIDFISQHIDPAWTVFEYGSGGSTLFWLSKGVKCISVEHDAGWAEAVKSRLLPAMQVDYRLVAPEFVPDPPDQAKFDISDPDSYRSDDYAFRNYVFKNYAQAIDKYPYDYFDLILVDGRARPSCLQHSIPKLKVGGLLVLDNAGRKYYLEKTQPLLNKFTKHEFRGATPAGFDFSQTNIYVKQQT